MGSEMCIRDSVDPARLHVLHQPIHALHKRFTCVRWPTPLLDGMLTLYTPHFRSLVRAPHVHLMTKKVTPQPKVVGGPPSGHFARLPGHHASSSRSWTWRHCRFRPPAAWGCPTYCSLPRIADGGVLLCGGGHSQKRSVGCRLAIPRAWRLIMPPRHGYSPGGTVASTSLQRAWGYMWGCMHARACTCMHGSTP